MGGFKLGKLSQMKHKLDATLCRFYFCRVTLHVSGASAHHQEYLKTSTAPTGTCVIVAGKSSHLLIRAGTQSATCNDNTCASGRRTSFKYS